MKFYTAGKTWHAPKFRSLRDDFGLPVQARWIDLNDNDDIVVNRKGDLWELCKEDVATSDFLLLYSENIDEEQRGALVELGMAYGQNKRVYAIGKCKSLLANEISDCAFTHHHLFTWLNTENLYAGALLAIATEMKLKAVKKHRDYLRKYK